jgi:hypothetical protein
MEHPVPSVGELLMLGIGTVFGTLVFLMVVLIFGSILVSPELPSLQEFSLGLLLYGGFGAVFASAICLVGSVPLILLFRSLFSALRNHGLAARLSAMMTSGFLALLCTVVVVGAAHIFEAIRVPPLAWPMVIVPALLAVGLSTRLTLPADEEALP